MSAAQSDLEQEQLPSEQKHDKDPSVFEDIVCAGKQIEIARLEGSTAEAYHRLGRVTAANHKQPWSMTWYNNGEKNCVPKGTRQEMKDNKYGIVPPRVRPDNHTALYDELKIWRRTDKANKGHSYEDGFRWPPDEFFDPIVDQIHTKVYMDSIDEDAATEEALGDEDFQGHGEGGLSEEEQDSQMRFEEEEEFAEEDEEGEAEDNEYEVDYSGSDESEEHPRRKTGSKRQHSPSPHISHKSMQKVMEEEQEELGTNLHSLLQEADGDTLEAEDDDEAGCSNDSNDERPYQPGLWYLCDTEWTRLPHDKVKRITVGVPANVMRYVAIQQPNKVTGLQSISSLGPVVNEVEIEFDVIDTDTEENLLIKLRAADQLWDEKHPKVYYPIVSSACDCTLDKEPMANVAVNPQSSDDLVIHSLQYAYSNRHKWSCKSKDKQELVGVGKFADYSHYRATCIYLGPSVRISNDKQLIKSMNKALADATCLHHYRFLYDMFKTTPVEDIQNYQHQYSQDEKNRISFAVAATDCTTQVHMGSPCMQAIAALLWV